jgi:sigma-B regulation protein RsbU (phosphoserine phosphatase)
MHTFSAAREDLRVARSMHKMLLPDPMPTLPNFDIRVWHEPSDVVGGECYDVIVLSGFGSDKDTSSGVLVALFDFPGSGVDAAIHGTQLRAALRIGIGEGLDLRKLAARLEGFVRADLPKVGLLNVWLLRVDDSAKHLTVLGLGDDALLCRRGLDIERISATGGPLGLGPIHDQTQAVELDLADEDTVLLVSDGVLDALDERRHRYGFAGLERALRELDCGTARDLIDHVRRDLDQYASGPRGDRTVVVLQAKGSGTASAKT